MDAKHYQADSLLLSATVTSPTFRQSHTVLMLSAASVCDYSVTVCLWEPKHSNSTGCYKETICKSHLSFLFFSRAEETSAI